MERKEVGNNVVFGIAGEVLAFQHTKLRDRDGVEVRNGTLCERKNENPKDKSGGGVRWQAHMTSAFVRRGNP